MAPSPSTAEGLASKPESTAILSKMRNDKPVVSKVSFSNIYCFPVKIKYNIIYLTHGLPNALK